MLIRQRSSIPKVIISTFASPLQVITPSDCYSSCVQFGVSGNRTFCRKPAPINRVIVWTCVCSDLEILLTPAVPGVSSRILVRSTEYFSRPDLHLVRPDTLCLEQFDRWNSLFQMLLELLVLAFVAACW